MEWARGVFSFDGRIGRLEYWLTLLAIGVVSGFLSIVPRVALHNDPASSAALFVLILIRAVSFWPYAATAVRRGHDRGYPAIWPIGLLSVQFFVLFFVQNEVFGTIASIFVVLSDLYLTIDFGFAPGNDYSNKFGPSRVGNPDGPPLVL